MIHLPLISEPPFFRPIEPHELPLIVDPNAPPAPDNDFHIGPGWTLSFFSFATTAKRVAAWGWTKGEFAIDERLIEFEGQVFYVAALSFLPNGFRVAFFHKAQDATHGAALLSRELDWSDTSIATMRAQAERARALLEEHFTSRDDDGPLMLWRARREQERAHG